MASEMFRWAQILTINSFMEGARIRGAVALMREVAKPTVVEDNGVNVTLKTGQQIFCNLVSLFANQTNKPAKFNERIVIGCRQPRCKRIP